MNESVEAKLGAGRLRGVTRHGARAFLGVPYAAAPTGARRFAPPAPAAGWAGVRDASRSAPPPPQPQRPISGFAHGALPPADEDCLALNVWAPEGEGPFPVLVWAIGGGWTLGWTGADVYDGARLAAAAQAVVIVPAYRLGSLGWLHHPAFETVEGVRGNWGLLDLVAALRWVQQHVAAFGGDPEQVTLGGQSAGAGNVAALLASPLGDGLFARAVLHSPPLPETGNDPARGARWSVALARALTGTGDVRALLDVPAAEVVAGHEALLAQGEWRGSRGAAWPTLDAGSLPVAPLQAAGRRPEVDVLVGTARDEATFLFRTGGRRLVLDEHRLLTMVGAVNGVTDAAAVVEREREAARAAGAADDAEALLVRSVTAELFERPVRRWARERAAAGGSVHVFRTDVEAPDPRLGALHTIDVPLLLQTFRDSATARGFVADDEAARAVSDDVQRRWGAFVAGGDPGWMPLAPDGSGEPFLVDR